MMVDLRKTPKDTWAIGAENTALVVIDMQRGFLEEGAPVVPPGGRELVPKINELVAMCRQVNLPVIFVRMSPRADLSDLGLLRDIRIRDPDNELEVVEGKKGADFYPGLNVTPNDYIVNKIRYSALIPGSSMLEPLLRRLGRDSIIICGVVTDVCVGTTTADAMMLGFRVFFISDLTATHTEERQKAALEVYNSVFAKVMTFDEVMKELRLLKL